jgi:hypothetical protein
MTNSFMEFPPDRQQQIEAARAQRQQARPRSAPGMPGAAARPVPDAGPQQQRGPQHAVRPPVQVRPPLGTQPVVEGLDWVHNAPPQASAAYLPTAPQHTPAAPLAPQQGTVRNVMPGFTNAIADAESMSLALPSRFAYYGFKDLYVKPFLAKHIAKLQKAHREQSLSPIVEAVSSVVFTTDERYAGRALAFDLTLPDFYMVLYWLRMNSFTKSNYVHTTRCNAEGHLKRVHDHARLAEYEEQVRMKKMTPEEFEAIRAAALPESSLDITQVITRSDIKVVELEKIPDPAIYHFSDTSAMVFRPPTMKDVVEFSESPELQDKDTREEFQFLAQLATHIQHTQLELSLAQRVEIVGNATADQVDLIKEFEKELGDYGVVDTVTVACKECGSTRETRLSIAAHSFFH